MTANEGPALQESIVALANGRELRLWIERQVALVRPSVIRCATFLATPLGLRWLGRLSGVGGAEVRLLCDVNQGCADLVKGIREAFPTNGATLRVAPAELGPSTDNPGLFHPKMIIVDDTVAVIGSANLTGKALEIGPKPHNVEMSVGLLGSRSRATIVRLSQYFDQW